MIVFDLECQAAGHRFEGWFGSSDDFASQQTRGLLTCPQCGSADVAKAPMAPSLGRKGNQLVAAKPAEQKPTPVAGGAMPAEAAQMMQALAEMQAAALKKSRWVGDKFAEESRAIHYGDREGETIHGQATLKEAKELVDEGIAVMPLPFPAVPPEKAN